MYKKEEGLGIRYMQIWNLAAVGKITWHISTMQDSLWVKWVHEVYMKGGRWDLLNASITASWVLKKLCGVKETLRDWMKNPKYSIGAVYRDLMGTTDKVCWATAVWNRAVILRSRFMVWLAYHERLKTKHRLKSGG